MTSFGSVGGGGKENHRNACGCLRIHNHEITKGSGCILYDVYINEIALNV